MTQPQRERGWVWQIGWLLFHLLVGPLGLLLDFSTGWNSSSEKGHVTVKKAIKIGLPQCGLCNQGTSVVVANSVAAPEGLQIYVHPVFVRHFLESN